MGFVYWIDVILGKRQCWFAKRQKEEYKFFTKGKSFTINFFVLWYSIAYKLLIAKKFYKALQSFTCTQKLLTSDRGAFSYRYFNNYSWDNDSSLTVSICFTLNTNIVSIIKKHKAMDEYFQNKSTLPEFVVRQGENTYIQGESMTIFFPSTFLISNMVFDGFTHNA